MPPRFRLLMSVDQEGGLVNRFRAIIGSQPGANAMTTPEIAYQRGQHDAQLLQSYGYNLNLAPVVDVGTANPQLLDRTFGSDPQTVATLAGAYMAGLQDSGSRHRLPQALPRHRRDDDGPAPGSASPDALARRLGAH